VRTELAIETTDLTRFFGRHCALDSVSLAVPRGGVTALLGRNGSGKSTLIQLILGLIDPTRGEAFLLGQPSRSLSIALLEQVGYVAEGAPLPGAMRVRDLRSFQQSFYPKRWSDKLYAALIEHFGIASSQKIGQLSRGQRTGFALALAIAPQPDLLVMDDPSLGLDPVARRALLEAMILHTRRDGTTIFFTSHELADVERVADHIAILDRSVLRVCCSLERFRERVRQVRLRGAPASLPSIPGLLRVERVADELVLTIANLSDATRHSLRELTATIDESTPSLEDAAIGYLSDRKASASLLQSTSALAEVSR
jgi:ABC-2 type transport system ATP-binding protein